MVLFVFITFSVTIQSIQKSLKDNFLKLTSSVFVFFTKLGFWRSYVAAALAAVNRTC
jgi:hypothetical protein